jgi:Protein of unknown function (DUF3551)
MSKLAAAAFAMAALCAGGTADAAIPTWCGNTADRSNLECRFYTWEQCQAYLSGLNGYCIPNPYLGAYGAEPPRRIKRQRYYR